MWARKRTTVQLPSSLRKLGPIFTCASAHLHFLSATSNTSFLLGCFTSRQQSPTIQIFPQYHHRPLELRSPWPTNTHWQKTNNPHHTRSSAHNTHNHGLTTTLSTLTTGPLIPRSPAPTHWSISHPPKWRTSPQTAPQTLHSKRDFFLAPSTTNLIPTARGLRLKSQCDVLARR
jgi:hypothetical protein